MIEQIDYEITIDDVINFNLYHSWDAPNKRDTRIKNRLIIPSFISIVLILFFVFTPQKQSFAQLLGLLVVVGLIFLINITIGQSSTRKAFEKIIRKMFINGKNLNYNGKNSLELHDSIVIHRTEYTESKISWNLFEKFIFTNEYLFIYESSITAIVIPMKFINIEQKERIERILNEKIK